MKKATTFQRSKSKWITVEAAFADLLQAQGFTPDQLEADHTETQFRWSLKKQNPNLTPEAEPANTDGQSKPAARDKFSHKQAIEAAMQELNTFEGNLQDVSTKTHFVFKKIRG